MIRPLATFLRALDAARTAGTLARTVRLLARQLDNAHLLAASEEARADRAELRVAELEHQLQDWREASGELAAEQPADDPLPSVLDAGEAPIPPVLTDSAREADIQRDRADALQRALQACEVELQQTRAQLRQTEAAAGAHLATIERLRSEAETCKWQHRTCSDCGAMQSFIGQGLYECWKCTATSLREQIAAAHRAAHAPPRSTKVQAWERLRTEATAAVEAYENSDGDDAFEPVFTALDEALAGLATVEEDEPAEQIPGVPAGTDDPPPTRPSERTATRTT